MNLALARYSKADSSNIEEIELKLNEQITTPTAYRKSLIHECVTGKRRISEADVAEVEAAL